MVSSGRAGTGRSGESIARGAVGAEREDDAEGGNGAAGSIAASSAPIGG
jgi:hypothetical protein